MHAVVAAQETGVQSESTNQLVISTLAAVHELEECVAAERSGLWEIHDRRFFNLKAGELQVIRRTSIELRVSVAWIGNNHLQSEVVLDLRQARNVKILEDHALRRSNVTSQGLLEIKDIAYLARLRHALPMLETFPAVVCDRILRTLYKIRIHHVATDHGASAAFTGIAVHKADILRVLLHEFKHLRAGVK